MAEAFEEHEKINKRAVAIQRTVNYVTLFSGSVS